MVEQSLVTLLSSVVSNFVGSRIYHEVAQQTDQTPYIVYNLIGRRRLKKLAGRDGLVPNLFQVDVFAQRTADLRAITSAIAGLTGAQPSQGVPWLWIEDEQDGYEAPVQGQEQGNKRATMELTVWYQEF